jgi:N-acetylmuramoyl-L-alanine amidase
MWYSDTLKAAPAGFSAQLALRVIGYDMRDTTAAIRAFKRHYMQDTNRRLTPADMDVLNDLMSKN